jgi:hypothetical protein
LAGKRRLAETKPNRGSSFGVEYSLSGAAVPTKELQMSDEAKGTEAKASALTRLKRSLAGEAADPDAYQMRWRLRAMLGDFDAVRVIAERNRHRWPVMAEELRQAYLLTVVNYETVDRTFEASCEKAWNQQ